MVEIVIGELLGAQARMWTAADRLGAFAQDIDDPHGMQAADAATRLREIREEFLSIAAQIEFLASRTGGIAALGARSMAR